ncbi:hypothetical protein GQ457_06G010060 [Hibiscus cannabinus]
MKKIFDKHWLNSSDNDYDMLFTFAVILDPRYKLSFLNCCYESLFENKIKANLKICDNVCINMEKLSYLAKNVLIVPFTTITLESTFSIRGQILNKWRSSYILENVEALITCSWLFG